MRLPPGRYRLPSLMHLPVKRKFSPTAFWECNSLTSGGTHMSFNDELVEKAIERLKWSSKKKRVVRSDRTRPYPKWPYWPSTASRWTTGPWNEAFGIQCGPHGRPCADVCPID